jgi:alkanesulfonate monooxygenase SsuD/methylene tetrahydromethanopterin reductase-like flavin-dependent oxidoreductase (luciferase family)
LPAFELYRKNFTPSAVIEKPYAMLAINIIAAETDKEAWRVATTQFQSFLRLVRGTPGQMQPPVETMEGVWTEQEKALVEARLGGSIIGDAAMVKTGLTRILDATKADELMINAMIYDHAARLRSYEIVADVRQEKTSAQTI